MTKTLTELPWPVQIREHIEDRLAKSKMDSPAINLTRPAWALVIDLLTVYASVQDHHEPHPERLPHTHGVIR